jgi:hypothetical protein
VDCIISTMTINCVATNKLCTLDRINVEEGHKFMTKRDVHGLCMRFVLMCKLLWGKCCEFNIFSKKKG